VFIRQFAVRGQQPELRSIVRLIMIPAAVTDAGGRPVETLEPDDFEVFVDGRIVNHQVEVETQPLSLIVAVQMSASVAPAVAKIFKVGEMIQPLIAGERGEAAVLTYTSEVTTVREFTTDPSAVGAAFRAFRPRGNGAAIHDAVNRAADMFATRPKDRRRVLMIVGESRDHGSSATQAEGFERVQRENIAIYSLTYSPFLSTWTTRANERIGYKNCPQDSVPAYQPGAMDLGALFTEMAKLRGKASAPALAQFTGGEVLEFLKQGALEKVVYRTGEDLHSQYLLSIQDSTPGQARYRAIQVRVKRPGCLVRARAGYWCGLE